MILATLIATFISPLVAQKNHNVVLRKHITYPGQTLANIFGYVAPDGSEYALIGASNGLDIYNVTDPDNPVHIVQIPGPHNLWKEIKTYKHYAYVTTEGGGGLQVVDLAKLPSADLDSHFYIGDGPIEGQLTSIHSLHVDTTKGFVYLYGHQLFNNGALVLDLNTDPYNPTYAGHYDLNGYVHDGYVDNDTLFASHIYGGTFAMVDMHDKLNPVVLAVQQTPTKFTHNTWLSDDRKYIFTTDENAGSFLACYDVSNPSNIVLKDQIQPTPGSGSIVHNTHIRGNYAITSWYKDGFTIVDITKPDNLIQVGLYDTYTSATTNSPSTTGSGFEGTWGVFPFFPSGTIVASNINEGLFIFTPTYQRACYLEGKVTDKANGASLSDVTIDVDSDNDLIDTKTNLQGNYETGQPDAGIFSVTYSKFGYISQTVQVDLKNGETVIRDIQLVRDVLNNLSGKVKDKTTQLPVADALVEITLGTNHFEILTDGQGNYLKELPVGTYEVLAGKWGYHVNSISGIVLESPLTVDIELDKGYKDGFIMDLGWTTSSTAASGAWIRKKPELTQLQGFVIAPGEDADGLYGESCYLTGNNPANDPLEDCVQDGSVTLVSPSMDLSAIPNPILKCNTWYVSLPDQARGSYLLMIDNGTDLVQIDSITSEVVWLPREYKLNDFIDITSTMSLRAVVSNHSPFQSIVRGGLDNFEIVEGLVGVHDPAGADARLTAHPNPFKERATVSYTFTDDLQNANIEVVNILGHVVQRIPVTTGNGTAQLDQVTASGVYFVRLMNKGVAYKTLKLVKSE